MQLHTSSELQCAPSSFEVLHNVSNLPGKVSYLFPLPSPMCDLFTETTMQQIKQYLLYPEGAIHSSTGWTGPVPEGYIGTENPVQNSKSNCVLCPTPGRCISVSN